MRFELCNPAVNHTFSGNLRNGHQSLLQQQQKWLQYYLWEKESPVEGELCDVVPPDITVHRVMRIVRPTIANVPEPFLAPKTDLEKQK